MSILPKLPVAASIIKASKEPYLGLVIQFDSHRLSEVVIKAFPHGAPKNPDMQPVYVGKSKPKIVKSAIRLMELINQQEDTDLLIPLVIDEILSFGCRAARVARPSRRLA